MHNTDVKHCLTATVINRVYEKESNRLYGYTLLIGEIYHIINKDSLLEKVRSLQLQLSNAKISKDGKVVSLYNNYIPTTNMSRKDIESFGSTTVIQLFCTNGKNTCALVYEKNKLMRSGHNNLEEIRVNGFNLGYNIAVGKIFNDNLEKHVYSNCRLIDSRIVPYHKYEQFSKLKPQLINILKLNGIYAKSLANKIEVTKVTDRISKISLRKLKYNEVIINIIWALIYDRLNSILSFSTDRFNSEELVITERFNGDKVILAIRTAFD